MRFVRSIDGTGPQFFGYMGMAAAVVFCSKNEYFALVETNGVIWNIDLGAAYGTAKSGVGICSMGVLKPDLLIKSIVPIIMAGILGIYGLIVAVILNSKGKFALLNTLFFSRSSSLHLRSRL